MYGCVTARSGYGYDNVRSTILYLKQTEDLRFKRVLALKDFFNQKIL
jgi:hypothetical protein